MAWTRRRRTEEDLPALRRAVEDADAFAELYDSLAERVLVFFTRRVFDGQLALDLAGETFAVTFEERARFRGTTVAEQEGWVFAIARTRLSRYWRRGSVEKAALERLGVAVPLAQDDELERIDELAGLAVARRRVAEELRNLPADQQTAIEGHIVRERSYTELSDELGVSEQVVRARVSRGLRRLGDRLEGVVEEGVP
jgi:RNA polymerase sigma-70 factor (ECF subfamily)